VFLYERFVKQAPEAENAANARRHIQELMAVIEADDGRTSVVPVEQPVASEPAAPSVPESNAALGQSSPATQAPPQIDRRSDHSPAPRPANSVRARLLIAGELGVSRLDFGRKDLGEAVLLPVGVRSQYRFQAATIELAAGLSVTGARFHEADREGVARALHLFGVLASFGAGWPAGGSVSVGPELAVGVIWWSGLDEGNRFTLDGAGASGGPVPMPIVRFGFPLEIAPSRSVVVTIRPELALARPGSGLRASIERLMSIGISAGAGIRF
jgi:hypothetical protein